MKCHEVRQWILEADLDELSGERKTPLHEHLLGCVECAGLARTILEQEEALGHLLEQIQGRQSADRVLGELRGRRRWSRVTLAGLAAAAAIAVVFLLPRSRPPRHPEPVGGVAAEQAVPLEVSSDRPFVVLSTGDPDVTVIWLN